MPVSQSVGWSLLPTEAMTSRLALLLLLKSIQQKQLLLIDGETVTHVFQIRSLCALLTSSIRRVGDRQGCNCQPELA